jgi:hypothetical protein
VLTSTNPAAGPSSWTVTHVDNTKPASMPRHMPLIEARGRVMWAYGPGVVVKAQRELALTAAVPLSCSDHAVAAPLSMLLVH